MPERRFRDMSLTDGEVELRVGEHVWQHYDPDGPGYDRSQVLLARARRLLPLWRKWGLRDLWSERRDAEEPGE